MLKLATFSALIALVVCQARPQISVFPFPPQPQPQGLPCGLTCSVRTSLRTTVDNVFSEMRCSDGTHLDGRCHNCCVAFAISQGFQSNVAAGFVTSAGCHCCILNNRCQG